MLNDLQKGDLCTPETTSVVLDDFSQMAEVEVLDSGVPEENQGKGQEVILCQESTF